MFQIVSFINSALALLLALFVISTNYKNKSNIFFFLLSIAIAIHFIILPISIYEKNILLSVFQVKLVHLCSTFIATFFYLFCNELLFKNTFQKLHHYFAILLAIITTYFIFFGQVIRGVEPLGLLPNWTVTGDDFYVYLINYAIYTFLPLGLLLVYAIRTKQHEQKQQIMLTLVGSSLALLAGWTAFLPGFGIKIEPYGLFFIFAFQFTVGYAILKYQMFDIKQTLSRFGASILASLGLIGAIVFSIYFYLILTSTFTFDIYIVVITALVSVIAGASFRNLVLLLQTSVEKTFIKGWYDLEKTLTTFAQAIESVYSLTDAIDVFKKTLSDVEMIPSLVVLPVFENDKVKEYEVDRVDIVNPLSSKDPFIIFFMQKMDLVTYDQLSSQLKEDIQTHLYLKGEMYIPLRSQKELIGILILNSKQSGLKYDNKDKMLINALRSQISVVLDRIRPYEKIKKEFESNQKKLFDLERMRLRSEKIASLAHAVQEYNHELRTPLQAILTQTEKLPDSEGIQDRKEKILTALERANDIVATTLRLSGEQEKKRMEESIEINTHLRAILQDYPIDDERHQLIDDLTEDTIFIYGDKGDLTLIINNLLKNSCEAMPKGGHIRVKTSQDDEFVHIEIRDEGIGIPENKLKTIWDPFQSRHVTKGRGLGLSIVYRLIREHNGRINVESTVGKGTSFKISIPIHKMDD